MGKRETDIFRENVTDDELYNTANKPLAKKYGISAPTVAKIRAEKGFPPFERGSGGLRRTSDSTDYDEPTPFIGKDPDTVITKEKVKSYEPPIESTPKKVDLESGESYFSIDNGRLSFSEPEGEKRLVKRGRPTIEELEQRQKVLDNFDVNLEEYLRKRQQEETIVKDPKVETIPQVETVPQADQPVLQASVSTNSTRPENQLQGNLMANVPRQAISGGGGGGSRNCECECKIDLCRMWEEHLEMKGVIKGLGIRMTGTGLPENPEKLKSHNERLTKYVNLNKLSEDINLAKQMNNPRYKEMKKDYKNIIKNMN